MGKEREGYEITGRRGRERGRGKDGERGKLFEVMLSPGMRIKGGMLNAKSLAEGVVLLFWKIVLLGRSQLSKFLERPEKEFQANLPLLTSFLGEARAALSSDSERKRAREGGLWFL